MAPVLHTTLFSLLAASHVFGAPSIHHRASDSSANTIPLVRRTPTDRSPEEWGQWAKENKAQLQSKYGNTDAKKRSTGTNLIVNQNSDSSFYGTLAIGTPATSYNVILDTGSSDLWVADSDCIVGCKGVPTFTSSASSSFRNLSQSFSITYGSGMARGVLGQDTVTMAGFSVAQQTFAICDTVSSGLLTNPVSGLLGLAWQTIASSGATPFWQTLANSGAWTEPLMAFQLTRFVNVTSSSELNPGGQFNMGFLNKSIYTGSVEYTNIPTGVGSYWIAPLTRLTVGGSGIALPGGSASYAAIDTGTTLVGGPPAQIAALYAQIPGAQQGTGDLEGYWTYPCATSVTVGMAFGGATTWQISPADFALAAVDRRGQTCLGAFFELETGGNAPAWIVGDTFLKNVYSVYRFSPPSIGFAALNNGAVQALADGPVPTPTIGAIVAEVSAGRSNGAMSSVRSLSSSHVIALTGFVASVAWML